MSRPRLILSRTHRETTNTWRVYKTNILYRSLKRKNDPIIKYIHEHCHNHNGHYIQYEGQHIWKPSSTNPSEEVCVPLSYSGSVFIEYKSENDKMMFIMKYGSEEDIIAKLAVL